MDSLGDRYLSTLPENVRLRSPALLAHHLLSPGTMSSPKLQTVLGQLSDLTQAELSLLKAAVDEELERQLRGLGINGDLTEEEWLRLEEEGVLRCFHMVRERTGLGVCDTKAYIDRARARGRKLPNV